MGGEDKNWRIDKSSKKFPCEGGKGRGGESMTKITCDHLEASEKSSTDDDYFFCKRVIFKNETFGCQLYSKRKKK